MKTIGKRVNMLNLLAMTQLPKLRINASLF